MSKKLTNDSESSDDDDTVDSNSENAFGEILTELFTYGGNRQVRIVIDANNVPYFNAIDLCKLLEYSDTRKTIRRHVNKQDQCYLIDIVGNYRELYKNSLLAA